MLDVKININQQNVIIVLGDLGAGSNFVKNVLLLSPDLDFPWNTTKSRLDFIISTVYPQSLKITPSRWISHEYKLRSWDYYYKVDISDIYSDINTQQVCEISQTRKIVFLCHDPAIVEKLKTKYPDISVVSLHADTKAGVAWQLSQYLSKIGIDRMHNFSFEQNAEQQKQDYIQQYGLEEYQKFNALNAFEIMYNRKNNYRHNDYITICIEHLQTNSWIQDVVNQLGININLSQAYDLAKIWRDLNPPYKQYWEII